MKKKKTYVALATIALLTATASCRQHYEMTSISRDRILIDKTFDGQPDAQATAFITPYRTKVDSIKSPLVGYSACYMAAKAPESNLTNFMTDILIWAGEQYNEKPDFGVYNIGGMRAAFPEGRITYGDVADVAPFENKICFVSLTGDKVMELFQQIVRSGGQGVSHGVELVAAKKGRRLLSAKLNGEDIDPTRTYRVATIDYVAQGNDGLTAFKDGTDLNSPQEERNNIRYVIMDYFRYLDKQGKKAEAKVEGRIKFKEE